MLSHSGSRGTGAQVCQHYSRIAQDFHRDLDRELRHLAWLDLDSHIGNEYWRTHWASHAAEGVIACPSQWPFGTQLQAFGRTWTCADRGGKIVGSWVDFMTPQPHVKYGTWIEAVLIQ